MKVLIKIFALAIGCIGFLNAQTTYKLESSEFSVAGTSTLHDWESSVNDVQIEGKFLLNSTTLNDIQTLKVTIAAKSIVSTKGSLMDNKTWDALKADKHPNITYKLNKVNSIKPSADGLVLNLSGVVNIAGVDKTIDMKVTGKVLNNGSLEFQGSKTLNMTDFNMKPPTAMLGAVKTGEEITVKFKVTLNAAKS